MKRKVVIDPNQNPIGTEHFIVSYANGTTQRIKYRVCYVWGADTFAPSVEPLVVSEVVTKEHYSANPFLVLPLSVFAETFPDTTFWRYVGKQDMPEVVSEAEVVEENEA